MAQHGCTAHTRRWYCGVHAFHQWQTKGSAGRPTMRLKQLPRRVQWAAAAGRDHWGERAMGSVGNRGYGGG